MLHLLGFGASLIVAGLGFIGTVVLSGFRNEAGEPYPADFDDERR
jgi:hypothetical protein